MARTPPPRLDDAAVAAGLSRLPGWARVGDELQRTFLFPDFVEAFGFMTRAALLAERAHHHPDWRNVYKRVEVRLSTHEAGGLTQRDLDLAAAFSALVAPGGAASGG